MRFVFEKCNPNDEQPKTIAFYTENQSKRSKSGRQICFCPGFSTQTQILVMGRFKHSGRENPKSSTMQASRTETSTETSTATATTTTTIVTRSKRLFADEERELPVQKQKSVKPASDGSSTILGHVPFFVSASKPIDAPSHLQAVTVLRRHGTSTCLDIRFQDANKESDNACVVERGWVYVRFSWPSSRPGRDDNHDLPLVSLCLGHFAPHPDLAHKLFVYSALYLPDDDHSIFVPNAKDVLLLNRFIHGPSRLLQAFTKNLVDGRFPTKARPGSDQYYQDLQAHNVKLEAQYTRDCEELKAIGNKYQLKPVIWSLTVSACGVLRDGQPHIRVRCGSDQLVFDVPVSPGDDGTNNRSSYLVKTVSVFTT